MWLLISSYGACFFLVKSKLDITLYLRTLPNLRHRLKYAPRKIIDTAGMNYLHRVGARLWYWMDINSYDEESSDLYRRGHSCIVLFL